MLKFASKSLQGDVRSKNDDRVAVYQIKDTTLALVCDGMGGHKFGDLAASEVISVLIDHFQNSYVFSDPIQTKDWIGQAVEKAKFHLKKITEKDPSKLKMGTTLVGALILPTLQRFFVFNCGDSRAYVYTNKHELVQITKDQNVANLLIEQGKNAQAAYNRDEARYLTSAIGPDMPTTVEIYEFEPKSYGNVLRLLMTTDGVHEFILPTELEFFASQPNSPTDAVDAILNHAIISNSDDNMSALVVDFLPREVVYE